MVDSEALRSRRYQAHRRGNHSLCKPERGCGGPEQPKPPPKERVVTAPRSRASSDGFGLRGQELWDAMDGVEMGPLHRALLVEACRLADRLDRFDRTLTGGKWFYEKISEDDPSRYEVVIDNVLSEARQYASALKAIVAEMEPKPGTTAGGKPEAPKQPTGIASLVERIEARRNGAVG